MKYSLWGEVQQEYKLGRGVYWVSTAGHGGLMISLAKAAKILSIAACAEGERWRGYLCFEEDCAYAVACYELTRYWDKLPFWSADSDESDREQFGIALVKSISRWNPEYLITCGETPSEPEYTAYKAAQENARRRKAKDPDLIVAAHAPADESVCHVWTADDKEYDVTSESYDKTNRAGVFSLADCVKMEVKNA